MSKQYQVYIKTGDVDNAGTNARVYIQLIGEIQTSTPLRLDNDEDSFERNKLDICYVYSENVGWIDQIRIYHDNTGNKPGWYLSDVEVRDRSVGLRWMVPINRWLAYSEDDRRIDITVDCPLGEVTLGNGVIMKMFLGFRSQQFNRVDPGSPPDFHADFTYPYKEGCSVDMSTSISTRSKDSLGYSFFDKDDSRFASEVLASVINKLDSHEEETYESTTLVDVSLAPGEQMTVATAYFQYVLRGKAYAGGVSVDYERKDDFVPETFTFAGLLSPSEVSDRIVWLTRLQIALPSLRRRLPRMNAYIPLFSKKLAKINTAEIKKAIKALPVRIITEDKIRKFPGARIYKVAHNPIIRKIANMKRPFPR